MKRGTLTLLSIFLLVAVFGITNVATDQARASYEYSDDLSMSEEDGRGQPIGLGGGGDGTGGPASTLESGDDDQPWDGIQSNGHQDEKRKATLILILDTWMETTGWLLCK